MGTTGGGSSVVGCIVTGATQTIDIVITCVLCESTCIINMLVSILESYLQAAAVTSTAVAG